MTIQRHKMCAKSATPAIPDRLQARLSIHRILMFLIVVTHGCTAFAEPASEPVPLASRALLGVDTAHSNPGFGALLAASDEWVAVYWALDEEFSSNHGRVRLYRRDGMRLNFAQVLAPEDIGLDKTLNFGSSGLAFSTDGRSLFVGMTSYHMAPAGPHGSVFVFRRNADEIWELSQTLEYDIPLGTTTWFGARIAVADRLVAVGEPNEWGPGSVSLRGRIHVYRESAEGQWQREAVLVPSAARTGSAVGFRFALADDQLAAVYDHASSEPTKLTVFNYRNGGWVEGGTLLSDEQSTLYGTSIAYSPTQQCLALNGLLHRVINDLWDKTAVLSYCRDGNDGLERTGAMWDGNLDDHTNYDAYSTSLLHVGNRLIVSAPGVNIPGTDSQGMLYEYHGGDATGWTLLRRHAAPDLQGMNVRRMGGPLVRTGPLLVVGAPASVHIINPSTQGVLLVRGIHDVFVGGFE